MQGLKQASVVQNKQLFKLFEAYEAENGSCYEHGLDENLVFTQAKTKPATVTAVDNMKEHIQNPFDLLFNWCKGEIYDLKALMTAFQQRDALDK